MPRCKLVPVEPWHIDHVAKRIRPEDAAEIWASSHSLAKPAIARGVSTALVAWTGLVDGEPVCIFGASPFSLLTGGGTPWMLATPKLERVERIFIRLSRPVVQTMRDCFPLLVNYVDNRNVKAHRWLAWLGFKLEEPRPHGVEGLPFRRFSWGDRHV